MCSLVSCPPGQVIVSRRDDLGLKLPHREFTIDGIRSAVGSRRQVGLRQEGSHRMSVDRNIDINIKINLTVLNSAGARFRLNLPAL